MRSLKELIVFRKFTLGALLAYFAGGLVLVPLYRWQLNPDGVAYLSIAHEYARGDLNNAVNAYWSPMMSWLLTPFAAINLNLQLAFKLINLCFGGVVLLCSMTLLAKWRISRVARLIAAGVLTILIWYWALPSPITPDLAIVAVFSVYLLLLNSQIELSKKVLLLGVVGAVGYYIKAFFLPFFLVHLAFYFWLHRQDKKATHNVKAYLFVTCVTAILILPWAAVMGAKYQRLTLGSSGSFNLHILDPLDPGQPVDHAGLIAPPNRAAVSSWDDPTYIKTPNWEPWGSLVNLRQYGQIVVENIRVVGTIFLTFSIFSLAIVAVVFGCVISGDDSANRRRQTLVLSATLVYVAGYCLLDREERYFWPAFLGIIFMGLLLYQDFQNNLSKKFKLFLAIVFTASIVVLPLSRLLQYDREGLSTWQSANVLRPYLRPRERIASDDFNSISYCYYLNLKCYGALNSALGDRYNSQQLKQYQIQAVIITSADPNWQKPTYLSNYHEVRSPNPQVRILELN